MNERASGESASRLIDKRIRELGGWRGETLARMRALILEADPAMTEEWKWMGTPVWSHHGNVCTGETYAKVVKLTFAQGARLPDPSRLFNSSLEGNTRRAIDIHEGETVDAAAFKALVRAAVAHNAATASNANRTAMKPAAKTAANAATKAAAKTASKTARKSAAKSAAKTARKSAAKTARKSAAKTARKTAAKTARKNAAKSRANVASRGAAGKPTLLAGGNPQIAKGDGDAPVQAYIAAMPGWKRDVGRRLDALIVRTVPDVRKAVKWNSPFYGIEGQGWFLNFHCFTKYVKVAFFRGASLRPVPPGESTHEDVRYLDIHESDPLDEVRLADWVKQASQLPGWGTT